ncbi:MAG: hypothetical protein HC869_16860 [Rhodospirillales bacterium]|nr:hypothetical protein [Rhodospirillales bacterium]
MSDFSLAAVLILMMTEDALAAMSIEDTNRLIGAMRALPDTPQVEAAIERLLDRMASCAPSQDETSVHLLH